LILAEGAREDAIDEARLDVLERFGEAGQERQATTETRPGELDPRPRGDRRPWADRGDARGGRDDRSGDRRPWADRGDARGARDETKDAIFADLNKKWADAKKKTS